MREAIEKLAASLDFPLKKLLVVEGSKRSAHSNAYFYGFWKNKCIVLFDTLVEEGVLTETTPTEDTSATDDEASPTKDETTPSAGDGEEDKKKKKGCNTAEVLGVLAHELGHWKLSHNLKNIVISEVSLYLGTCVCVHTDYVCSTAQLTIHLISFWLLHEATRLVQQFWVCFLSTCSYWAYPLLATYPPAVHGGKTFYSDVCSMYLHIYQLRSNHFRGRVSSKIHLPLFFLNLK